MSNLKVYQVTGTGGESVWTVADDPKKAEAIYCEYMSDEEDDKPLEVLALPDDEPLEIGDEDTDKKTTKTAKEWADSYGEGTGLLCASIW